MKHLFVINPHSFAQTGYKHILNDINECFANSGETDYEIRVSRYPRDAVAVVHNFIKCVPKDETVRIYAVGGDGILFDCLNGMVDFPNAELTTVPYGSANDFARIFGEKAYLDFRDLKKLIAASSRPIDIINCGTNYALLAINIGLVGETVYTANKILRKKSSAKIRRYTSNIYSLAAVKTILNYTILNQQYTIEMDDKDVSGNYSNIHIANSACDGGSFVPQPYAKPDDGLLDIIFIHPTGRLSTIMKVIDRNNGYFEKHDVFEYKKCRKINIKSDKPLCIQMDGEAYYAKEFDVKIVPNGIKIFAPENLEFADYSHRAYSKKHEEGSENEN